MTFPLERFQAAKSRAFNIERAGFRRQPASQDDRAIVVVPPHHTSGLLLAGLARQLLRFLAAAIRAHEFLDVLRGAVLGDHQQVVLRCGAGDTRDLARLGVAQAATRHRRGDLRQILERARDPHLLPRRAHRDSTLPVQPVRARLRGAVRPAISPIEFGDENQPAMARRVDVAGEGADLRGEFVDGAHGLFLVPVNAYSIRDSRGEFLHKTSS